MKSYRKQVVVFIALMLLLNVGVILIVSYFDPLMCTSLINGWNRITPVIDSRFQKTSRLLNDHSVYDALLIGSSRVEQFRQEDFAPLKVFNYGLPSLYPDEYREYIDFFLRAHGATTKKIFIGLDFYGTNAGMYEHAKSPSFYIDTCSSVLYPLRSCMSWDSVKHVIRMLRGKRDQFCYDRITLNKLTKRATTAESADMVAKQIDTYRRNVYGGYHYNTGYGAQLRALRERYGKFGIVVFTTPETERLFQVLIEQGRVDDYIHWLNDIVEVFGEVYDLSLPGSFAATPENFLDAHHLYPERASSITAIITGGTAPTPGVLGYHVTKANLRQHLDLILDRAEQLRQL